MNINFKCDGNFFLSFLVMVNFVFTLFLVFAMTPAQAFENRKKIWESGLFGGSNNYGVSASSFWNLSGNVGGAGLVDPIDESSWYKNSPEHLVEAFYSGRNLERFMCKQGLVSRKKCSQWANRHKSRRARKYVSRSTYSGHLQSPRTASSSSKTNGQNIGPDGFLIIK